ncbi:MAG: WD40/YVTN/BNR-like repeat-containing protein, partial [Candidatus Aminicenantales bacterium]
MRRRHLTASVLGLLALAFLTNASRGEKELFNEDLLKFFRFRALGPARQGSRILDIEVPPGRPYTFYVATASGGLWKTENNGTTFRPIFDDQTAIAIGDVAVAPSNPDILWVGTGTPASGRITLRGDGVYKSTDGGRTWTYAGLKKTRHIGRIAIHPQNPDIVYVAALGYHFSFNRERGLFKTTDGGATWEKVLYISERVGVVDVALNPENPDIVYAVTYDKWRLPWHFEESGPESGIYKSTDAGKTWRRLERGLPKGKFGRIGIAIYPKNPDILYAIVENANMRPPTEEEAKQDRAASRKPENRRIGGEVYRSDDGGESWTKRNAIEDNLGGGKWYGQIRVDPNDDQVVYVMSTRLQRSMDGGRTWGKKGIENLAAGVHVDHHVVWIDPENSNHLILGNDGGLYVSYDSG